MVSSDEAEEEMDVSDCFSDRGGRSMDLDRPDGTTSLIVERLEITGSAAAWGRAGNLGGIPSSSKLSPGVDGGEVACEKRLDRVGDCEEP